MAGKSSETLTFNPVTEFDQVKYHCRSTFPAVGQFVYGGVTSSEEITLTVHRELSTTGFLITLLIFRGLLRIIS